MAGLAAGLGVVGLAYGASAVVSHGQSAETKRGEAQQAAPQGGKPVADGATPAARLVATGRTLYVASCAGCHGQDAQGQIGPTLHHLGDPDVKIARNIKNGFPPRMPGFADKYDDAQIKALVAYVQSLE